MKKKPELDALDQILARLSVEQGRAVLRALAQDPNLAPLILQAARTQLEAQVPHSPDEAETMAEDVLVALEQLAVEEVWDRAGRKRTGYVATSEAADKMIGEALRPFLDDLARCNVLGLADEALYLCLGILSGLYRFEFESVSKFKEWSMDLPGTYCRVVLEEWKRGGPPKIASRKLRGLIRDRLPRWATSLLARGASGGAG
jgi:hypothetical protein